MEFFDFLRKSSGKVAEVTAEAKAAKPLLSRSVLGKMKTSMLSERMAQAENSTIDLAIKNGIQDPSSKEFINIHKKQVGIAKASVSNEISKLKGVNIGDSSPWSPRPEKMDYMGAAGHIFENGGVMSKAATWGMGGAVVAAGGSAFYGAMKVGAPNNTEVNNPVKNMVKGAMIGAAGGAIFAASHGIGGLQKNLVNKELGAKLAGMKGAASMTKNALGHAGMIAAIGAATFAGSGDLNFTKPLNPVY